MPLLIPARPARGSHLLSSPRAPAALATPAAAPAHFPVGPRPSVPGRTWSPAAAPPAGPLSMPRAAPPRVIRLGLGGGREARRGGTGLPGRRRRRRSGNREDPAEGRGAESPRAARAEWFQENWNPNLIPWKTGEKEVVAVIQGQSQGHSPGAQMTRNSISALGRDLAHPVRRARNLGAATIAAC